MTPDLSVVIPIYNEEENVANLVREFREALTAWGRPYELILVDDGSTDRSFELLKGAENGAGTVRDSVPLQLGQTAAFTPALRMRAAACGYGRRDLQNDPKTSMMVRASNPKASTSSPAGARTGRTRSFSASCRRW